MFYRFHQNNSGGSFDYDEDRGISVNVIVEADNYRQANERARSIGLYFDGSGDCPCCGDRWSEICDWEEGDQVPSVWGAPVHQPMPKNNWSWVNGYDVFVHYLDGTIKGFWKGERK